MIKNEANMIVLVRVMNRPALLVLEDLVADREEAFKILIFKVMALRMFFQIFLEVDVWLREKLRERILLLM